MDRVNPLATLSMPLLDEDMRRFEPLLAESIIIGDPFLDEVTTHLLAAGGKRLRPLLAIASALFRIDPHPLSAGPLHAQRPSWIAPWT